MWKLLPLLLVLAARAGAVAEDAPRKESPAEAAAQVAAMQTPGSARLAALAARDDPDPWLVAEALLHLRKADAAAAFATAAVRPMTAKLGAYVEARRGHPAPPSFAAVQKALAEERFADALALATALQPEAGSVTAVRREDARGAALFGLRHYEEAAATHRAAAVGANALGWLHAEYRALHQVGRCAWRRHDGQAALSAWRKALPVAEATGVPLHRARVIGSLGLARGLLGQHELALARMDAALAIVEPLQDHGLLTELLNNRGSVLTRLGRPLEARESFTRLLTLVRDKGPETWVPSTLNWLGIAEKRLGRPLAALGYYKRALALAEEQAKRGGSTRATSRFTIGDVTGNIGVVYSQLGRYAESLVWQKRSMEVEQDVKDREGWADGWMNLGELYGRMGQQERALDAYAQGRLAYRAIRHRAGEACSWRGMGGALSGMGRFDEALQALEKARVIFSQLGQRADLAHAHTQRGILMLSLGRYEEARRDFTERVRLGLPMRGENHVNVGVSYEREGRFDAAVHEHERALALLPPEPWNVAARGRALAGLARSHLQAGRPEAALRYARGGLAGLRAISGALGEEQGADTRELWRDMKLHDAGAAAAARLGDATALAWFLESGRAGGLRDALRAGATLRESVLPAALVSAEDEATQALVQAERAYARAQGRDLAAARAARATMDTARAALQAVVERIQSEARNASSVLYPEPDDLATLQAAVRPDEALVLYVLTQFGCGALVVRPKAVRIVELGPARPIEDLCEALLADAKHTVNASVPPRLHALVIEPLALDADVERVIVSPMGRLGYVPFPLLMLDRSVATIPAGSVLRILRERKTPAAQGILALGDPVYGKASAASPYRAAERGRLQRLPATRAECKAIGTMLLLDEHATEQGLRTALAQRVRWKAVHLACHGLIDPDRPLFSSLAITPGGEDDGFLTCLEVFRMRVPADLVVLSACETGKGRVYRSEGILGLARAFMYAGAPRVLCSLWKVDDEATRALMVKFYELWNPRAKPGDPERPKGVEGAERKGLGAAAALTQAQAFVRSHEKWRHPYFWGAWVLWGLPD